MARLGGREVVGAATLGGERHALDEQSVRSVEAAALDVALGPLFEEAAARAAAEERRPHTHGLPEARARRVDTTELPCGLGALGDAIRKLETHRQRHVRAPAHPSPNALTSAARVASCCAAVEAPQL